MKALRKQATYVSPSTDSLIQETAAKCEAENDVRILSELFLTVCGTRMK